eukprot:TRINITY_DN109922_c0_g1_i1.p1 TRINITY_DN109922_c0_g1~~TRINITY_DN109922_c0_g1_i1.p1  ORF type:complete len:496 (-),score=85.58 TRINITY_DN109922_c0_g1_i1:133-1620(-)
MDFSTPNEAIADLQKKLLEKRSPKFRRQLSDGAACSSTRVVEEDSAWEDSGFLKTPGGFRRHFLHKQASTEAAPWAARPVRWRQTLMESLQPLIRVGYFESILRVGLDSELSPEVSMIRGTAGTWQTCVSLVKSFVGVGILFMPGAFSEGGWLFSALGLITVAAVSASCIWLLVDCQDRTGGTDFCEIASLAAGTWGKQAVQVSLVLSQLGNCVAYIAFITETAGSLGVESGLRCFMAISVIIVPLCLLRSMQHLRYPVLLSTTLAFFGLGVASWYNARAALDDQRPAEISAFKPSTCGLFLGTATFAYAGIPMMLPIRNAMREPSRFWSLFLRSFSFVVFLELLFGLAGYCGYGDAVKQVIFLNLPNDWLVFAAKLAYVIGLVCGFPLMFLPAAMTTELWMFGKQRKGSKKWQKNVLRTAQVGICGIVALYGGTYFEKLLALIGAFCAAPIAFIYPCIFHLSLCSTELRIQIVDVSLLCFGVAAMALAILQALW